MSIVGHDTDMMRNWSSDMNSNDSEYLRLVKRLYNLVDEFAGSTTFKGGLSEEFVKNLDNLKKEFLDYSTVFNECSELIKHKSFQIDDEEAEDTSMINRNNPLA